MSKANYNFTVNLVKIIVGFKTMKFQFKKTDNTDNETILKH